MIPFDFVYIKPDTLQQAFDAFREMDGKGLNPMYYGGGTEIITMARVGSIRPGAIIDIKAIPECVALEADVRKITIGSGVTLSQICEANHYPLLSKAAGRIADHTVQCKLTLGGNITGTIIYKEAVLPLMLADCSVELFGPGGLRRTTILQSFDTKLLLQRGEFLVCVMIDRAFAGLPYVHAKKTPIEKIGYPVVTVCAIKKAEKIYTALSGACDYPLHSTAMDNALNTPGVSREQRARQAVQCFPTQVLSDSLAAGEYRKFVLYCSLIETLERLEA